jgi:hypothetical protein
MNSCLGIDFDGHWQGFGMHTGLDLIVHFDFSFLVHFPPSAITLDTLSPTAHFDCEIALTPLASRQATLFDASLTLHFAFVYWLY